VPAQHYPYLALPVRWRMGKEPEVAEPRGTAMAKYMYCLGYRKDVDLRWAEDWYLGHHTREGKQLPGLMRYVTYRRRRLPRLDECRPEVADRWLCRPSIPTAGLSRRSG